MKVVSTSHNVDSQSQVLTKMFSEQILRHICLSPKTVTVLQIKDQEEQYLSESCQLGFSQTPTSEKKNLKGQAVCRKQEIESKN